MLSSSLKGVASWKEGSVDCWVPLRRSTDAAAHRPVKPSLDPNLFVLLNHELINLPKGRWNCLFLTAVGQCKLLDAVPYAIKKSELPSYIFHNYTTIVTGSARDVQGTERLVMLPSLRSRPPGLADSQHSAFVINSLSFSLAWGHSVVAQKSSFFFSFIEHKPWQQKRWANCNYMTIPNAFCILTA